MVPSAIHLADSFSEVYYEDRQGGLSGWSIRPSSMFQIKSGHHQTAQYSLFCPIYMTHWGQILLSSYLLCFINHEGNSNEITELRARSYIDCTHHLDWHCYTNCTDSHPVSKINYTTTYQLFRCNLDLLLYII